MWEGESASVHSASGAAAADRAALAAIADAVARATGGRVRRLPLAPLGVLDLIETGFAS